MPASTAPFTSPSRGRPDDARPTRGAVPAIGIGARRRCSRSSCSDPATATLVFSYDEQIARVVVLLDESDPQVYDLCGPHADRTSPPQGWELADSRPQTMERARRVEDEDTVAVIAAVLRGEDTPRRVDVIDGGDPTGDPPRRVTVTEARAATSSSPSEQSIPDDDTDEDEDPLRAALEELQRVVEADADMSVEADADMSVEPDADMSVEADADDATTPAARRLLPPPPSTPPPGQPTAAPVIPALDRPTLW